LRDRRKSEDQLHAKQIANAPEPALWSPDKERRALPVAGDAEWPLPDARGHEEWPQFNKL
jgi:hypothetical protein